MERVRALDLVRHRLADVVQERRALRRLDSGAELRGHHAAEVDDLERVLEHVLAVARAVAEPAEDLDQLLVEVAAVRLEHGLLAGLLDVVLDLGLGLVVHLLDPRRMDPAVLDQLDERQLGGLAAMPSKDESTTACGVSSMMKSTPVRCSSARMLRPSRPMIRPFMSSDGSSTSVTVVSAACVAATRCSASATRLRARRLASVAPPPPSGARAARARGG